MHAQTSGGTLPALMNPCSLSLSIPLVEGICCAISDMNADQTMVTQKTLVEQLVKRYPGIAVPSQKILHNILGTLIKERKIYHTGEGYFIITPNMYFVTNDVAEYNNRGQRTNSEDAYQATWESCADPGEENIAKVSRCLPGQNMLCEQRLEQLMNQEPEGGGKKGCSDGKPLIQTQVISSSAENRAWDTMKTLTSVKEKLKCRRFGLGLFWRSTSKKEKHKEYSTFSAQFPPSEWPVRDEDDLDNIPRDVEHEIIRCINPTLTVDNLIKHTRLMQKFEERKTNTTKDISAEVLTLQQKYLSKECVQKAQIRTAKHKRKKKPNREKQISRNNLKPHVHEPTPQSEKLEENISLLVTNQQPLDAAVESQVLYKKQIKNPFQGLSWRHSFYAKAYKGRINSQQKSRRRKRERDLQRLTKSLESPGASEYEAEQLLAEVQADNTKQNKSPQAHRFSFQLKKNSLSDNVSYLHSSTLRIDDKHKYFLESNVSEDNICRGTVKRNPGNIKKSPDFYTEDKSVRKEKAKHLLHLKGECCRYKADAVGELLDQAANEFQNVHLSNYTTSVTRETEFGVTHRQKTDKKNELVFKYDCTNCSGSTKLESNRFTNRCHLQNQKVHDCDKCSLLHLDDNFECKEPHQLLSCHAFSVARDWSKAVQKMGTALKISKVNIYSNQYNTTVNRYDSGGYGYKGSADFTESTYGSKKHQKPDLAEESCLCSQVLPMVSRQEKETSFTECMKASAVDFCDTDEADALQNRTCEMAEVVPCHNLGPQAKEARTPPGITGLILMNEYTVIPGQNHTGGAENHSITGDSGIDSPRWTEKKMKLPAKL
ncbi:storkhead-box protein 1 isoform X1 [Tympanuchus pallidicinctus]|uniref:storkhead-box protein 1 isoform X1 n=2 Tax=Tympanuchus pallidicinctus TaxID=109042 RepID=UPI0022874F14|nr:storkhead-box protein 1 isoform X1 [Tympanuchus pallidicinctus]